MDSTKDPGPALLTPDTGCWVTVEHVNGGGVLVEVNVPTYDGGERILVSVTRDSENDWYVDVHGLHAMAMSDGSPLDGTVVVGAPDEPVASRLEQLVRDPVSGYR